MPKASFLLNSRTGILASLILCFLMLGFPGSAVHAQTNEWTWMAGLDTTNPEVLSDPSVYGTQGVFAPGNMPGGRNYITNWTDLNGNFWLYGGGSSGDGLTLIWDGLWEFDPKLNEWAWIAGGDSSDSSANGIYGTVGVAGPGDHPGLRQGGGAWTDSKGRLWMFGGLGYPYTGLLSETLSLNDLWMFDPSIATWTWMGGSPLGPEPAVYGTQGTAAAGNIPGGRAYPSTWTDSKGRFWLYGGEGYDSNNNYGYLSDMWVYDPSTGNWTWVLGSDTVLGDNFLTPAVYGSLGVAAAGNTPGSRVWDSFWADKKGNFWLFGGFDEPNDLWEFNPTTNEWAWITGSNTVTGALDCGQGTGTPCPEYGVYGSLGVLAAGNTPGLRQNSFSWTDQNGEFWLYGGEGEDSEGGVGLLNDLWRFDPPSNEWAWMNGSPTLTCGESIYGYECELLPVFGTKGTPSQTNTPGGRESGANWVDLSGNLWLFGGSTGLSDMWEYQPSVINLPPAITPVFSLPSGQHTSAQTLTISNGMPNASIFYTTDGSTPTSSSTLYNGPISIASTETVTAIATAPGYEVSGLTQATYEFMADVPTFSLPGGTYTSVISLVITSTIPNATINYTTDGSLASAGSTLYTGPITISSSETVKAVAVLNGYESDGVSASYVIEIPGFSVAAQPAALTVNSGSSGTVTLTVTPSNGFNAPVSFACSGLPSGASCAFSPATVTPAGAAVSTTLTISAVAQTASLGRDSRPAIPGTALALVVCLFGWRKRRSLMGWLVVAVAVAGMGLLSSCGGAGSGGGGGGGGGGGSQTQPVTSTVTVTATSGSIQETATVSLTLN